ncbi:ABC transporter permease [Cytobacillus sp. FJAT-54145]|uniref:ABC transporter permease n=1 Tax=Cytobacillus spartinae TaxID=3299023 RepID=A0ABW6K9M8_9BACI
MFHKYRKTTILTIMLLLFLGLSFVYPFIGPEDYGKVYYELDEKANVISKAPYPPSFKNLLGTDLEGRDMLLLLVDGAKFTIITALLIAVLRVILGGIVGILLSMWIPKSLTYFKDFFLTFRYIPTLILAIALMMPVTGRFTGLPYNEILPYQIAVLVIVAFPSAVIFMSDVIEELKTRQFIEVSYLMGASRLHILIKHLLPYVKTYSLLHLVQQFFSTLVLLMHLGIFGLFLGGRTKSGGIGTDPDAPPPPESLSNEWAGLIGQSFNNLLQAPWMVISPMLAFFVLLFITNVIKKEIEESLSSTTVKKKKREKSRTNDINSDLQQTSSFVFIEK